jgi:hypothetical protein
MSFDEEHLDDHYLCQREVAERDQRIDELEAALRELLDSQETLIPPFEAGIAAQNAWADRQAKARNDAVYLLAGAPPSDNATSDREAET